MANMKLIFLSLLIFAVTVENTDITKELVEYINLALASFRDVMKNGIPEFGIPALEPIKLGNISANGSGSGVNIQYANFTNLTLYGLSTMQVADVQVKNGNKPNQLLSFTLQLKFDNWTIKGNYNMSGKVMGLIPLKGNGLMDMQLIDVVINTIANLTSNPNGTFTIKPNDFGLDVQTGKMKFHFHDLYGGGSLSGFANKIANFFSGKIFDNIKPKLIEKISKTLRSTLNRKLENIKLSII